MKYFTDDDLDNLVFFQVPKVLVLGEKYKKMKPNALKLYMVLFDRMKLSMSNGWKDELGRYYVRMSQDGASELFTWSPTTFRSMKKELEQYELLTQDRQGLGKANRLYILKCEYTEADVYIVNKSVDMEIEGNEKEAQTLDATKKNKSWSSRRTKVDLAEGQQLTSINTNSSNNDFRENNLKTKDQNIVNKEVNNREKINYELSNEYRLKGLNKNVCLRVIKEVNEKKERIIDYEAYLRSCFETILFRVKRNMKKENLENKNDPDIYYNWLKDKN